MDEEKSSGEEKPGLFSRMFRKKDPYYYKRKADQLKIRAYNWNFLKSLGRKVGLGKKEEGQKITIKQEAPKGPRELITKKRFPWLKTIIIVLLIVFIISGFISGFLPTKIKQGFTSFKQSEIGMALYGFFSKVFNMVVFPEKSFGNWQNPDAKETGDVLAGITIDKIEDSGPYVVGDKIVISNLVKINNIDIKEEKLRLYVFCELDDYKGEVRYLPDIINKNIENKEHYIDIYPTSPGKVNDIFSFDCIFENGIDNIDSEVEGKTVSANISFSSVSDSDLFVYIINRDIVAKAGGRADYAEKYLKPLVGPAGLWGGDGIITSRKKDSGPMTLALGTNPQPFSKDSDQAKLVIRFSAKDEGRLREIKSFDLKFPKSLEPTQKFCGCLTNKGEIYSLAEDVKKNINTEEERWSTKDCVISGSQRDLKFGCWLTVKEDKASPEREYIKAQVKYKYSYEKSRTIEIRKQLL
ncbi:MAG: hypothetical protein PHT54_03820 [Candidatus Nanoarchaeia archaeon]|nr:hypothetical protein [Candidatus Nanoarchaeia archaeon]